MTKKEMMLKTEKELREFLESNKLYYMVYTEDDSYVIDVEWGDWKHDHGHLGWLVTNWFEAQGRVVSHKSQTTEQDGSDCYSALHYFKEVI